MSEGPDHKSTGRPAAGWFTRLSRRGVLRVAFSYAVIAWLLLQIGDVVLDPLGAPGWVMRALIVIVIAGFPVALLLAWFLEITPAGIKRDTLPESSARPTVSGIRQYADMLIIGVLVVAVGFLLARQEGWIEEDQGQPVIGVLPFTELGIEEQDYFGAGLADTLTYKLGLLKQLIVLAPSSTLEFRGQGQDLKVVGAKLGATALLEGTVRRATGMLRVNARLVDIGSGQQLWSGSYDRSGTDLFAIQDEIAAAVTQALHLVLSPEEQTRLIQPMTASLTAYDAYLLGREQLARRNSETISQAVDHFRRAIELDPSYALAHAALAEAIWLTTSYHGWDRDWEQEGPKARRAAATAQALDPNLGEAYLAQAIAAMGDNDFAEGNTWPEEHIAALLKRAVELSPNNALAWKFYANSLGSDEEGLNTLLHAAQLDPRSGIILVNVGEIYFRRGDYQDAKDWVLRAAATSDPPFFRAYKVLIENYVYEASRPDVAARWGKALMAEHPDVWEITIAYARALLELGAWDEERVLLDKLPEENENSFDDTLFWIRTYMGARLAIAEGDFDAASELTSTFSRLYFELLPTWPDLSALPGSSICILDIQALIDIQNGRPQVARDRYRLALTSPESRYYFNVSGTLRTPVLVAVLQRMTGNFEAADRELRDFLERISGLPIAGIRGIGFTRFTALAFLGETDAAIAELQQVIDTGWLPGWWGLKSGAFDSNYARVIADPRFLALYDQLESRVRQMREDFRMHPELPEDQQIESD